MDSNLGAAAMEVAARRARQRFAKHPDREDLVRDAQSVAWELSLTAGEHALAESVGKFAVKRVASGRQFRQSVRSIDGPRVHGKTRKPERTSFDPAAVFSDRDDPARIVAMRLDLLAWFATLTDRQRAAALVLATGEDTTAAAAAFGCTPPAISDYRKKLAKSWKAFQG